MAVYQTKTFARWAKKAGLQDTELYVAAQEVAAGQVEVKLGGNVYKKRVALPGGGKSGGSRTIIATKKGRHSFFLYGFEKNERSNIKTSELSIYTEKCSEGMAFNVRCWIKSRLESRRS